MDHFRQKRQKITPFGPSYRSMPPHSGQKRGLMVDFSWLTQPIFTNLCQIGRSGRTTDPKFGTFRAAGVGGLVALCPEFFPSLLIRSDFPSESLTRQLFGGACTHPPPKNPSCGPVMVSPTSSCPRAAWQPRAVSRIQAMYWQCYLIKVSIHIRKINKS